MINRLALKVHTYAGVGDILRVFWAEASGPAEVRSSCDIDPAEHRHLFPHTTSDGPRRTRIWDA